jgi:flagellar basal-body rod modification protein FlgD
MNVTGTSSSAAPTVSPRETGFNALSSEDFLKMMLAQLQNQDPFEPTGNEELLNQISQMRSLQSGIELSEVLESLGSQQQLTSAAALIGKTITGTITGADGKVQTVEGLVERAFVRGGEAFVAIGFAEIAIENVTDVE